MACLQLHFGSGSESWRAAANREESRWLTFDGYYSHLSKEFLLKCLGWRDLPVCRFPYTFHSTCLLGILKCRPKHRLHTIRNGNVYKLLVEALKVATTPENIGNGICHTRLLSVDRKIVINGLTASLLANIRQQTKARHRNPLPLRLTH